MYSKKLINIISIFITLVIFLISTFFFNSISLASKEMQKEKMIETTNANKKEEVEIEKVQENYQEAYTIEKLEEVIVETEEIKWEIEIPSISLKAKISEGTDKETLDKYVGHFTSTQKLEGNIGLAAHNRGYPVNYFSNIKDLNYGDEIIYRYDGEEKTYIVKLNTKISDIDWSYLQNTNENKITLITCIANEPAYRRCVQAIEKQERSYNIY